MLPVPDEILTMKPAAAYAQGQSVGMLLGGLLALVAIMIALDARERGWARGAALWWGVATFAAALPTLIFYFLLRSRGYSGASRGTPVQVKQPEVQVCRYCQKSYVGDPAYCPHCSSQLKGAEEIHKGR